MLETRVFGIYSWLAQEDNEEFDTLEIITMKYNITIVSHQDGSYIIQYWRIIQYNAIQSAFHFKWRVM